MSIQVYLAEKFRTANLAMECFFNIFMSSNVMLFKTVFFLKFTITDLALKVFFGNLVNPYVMFFKVVLFCVL